MSLHDCRDDSDIPTSPTWSSTNPGGGSDDHASTGGSAGEGHFFFPVSRSTADPAGATTSALMFPDAMSPVGDPSPSSDDHGRHQQSQNVDDDSGDNEDRSSSDAGDASPSLQSTTSAGAPISECDDSSQVNNSEHSSDGNGSHYPASDIALSNTAAIGRLRGNSKSKLCDMNGVAPTITAGTSTTTTTITPKGIVSTTPRGRGRPRMLPQIGTPPAIPEEQSQTRWLTTITPNSTTSASAAAASVATRRKKRVASVGAVGSGGGGEANDAGGAGGGGEGRQLNGNGNNKKAKRRGNVGVSRLLSEQLAAVSIVLI